MGINNHLSHLAQIMVIKGTGTHCLNLIFQNFYISGRCGVLKSCKNSERALKNTAHAAEKSATTVSTWY